MPAECKIGQEQAIQLLNVRENLSNIFTDNETFLFKFSSLKDKYTIEKVKSGVKQCTKINFIKSSISQ